MIASSILMITAIAIAEAIMFIRVFALSQHDKRLGIWLAIQYFAVHIAIYVVLGKYLVAMEYMPSPLPQLVACMPTDTNTSRFSAVFAMIVASEAAIMVISLIIGFSRYRSSGTRLLTAFRRDGIFYFVTMAAVAIGNIIFDSVAPLEFKFMLMAPQGFLHSLLSCRLILHMHQLAEEEIRGSLDSENKTSIQFAREPEKTVDVASSPGEQTGQDVVPGENKV
ncbi:hypothetical protein NMY22_g11910 [Coprinellus aureogranulatus]|nr:hypothetical protein NMY22_g11910 [Coprinellus aureogranulatus]